MLEVPVRLSGCVVPSMSITGQAGRLLKWQNRHEPTEEVAVVAGIRQDAPMLIERPER
jgi:hypothetical protein